MSSDSNGMAWRACYTDSRMHPQLTALERLDELPANDLALLLRIGDAGQLLQKLLARIMRAQIDLEMIAEG